VQARVKPSAILWRQVDALADTDMVDHLIATLPSLRMAAPDPSAVADRIMARRVVKRAGQRATPRPAAYPAVANDRLAFVPLNEPMLDDLRDALYGQADVDTPPRHTAPMRLAVHAMNATLIAVWAPLGAAAMTYSILKGEDMRLSARLMLLGGSIAALSQTPIGQHMVAFSGI